MCRTNKLNKKIQLLIRQIIIFLCFTTLVNPQLKASINKENQIYEIIEKFTKKSSKIWSEDKLLKTIRIPQTIILDADSRIYFSGCFRRGENLKTIEGSSYCNSSHTIYLTKEDVEDFYKLSKSYGLIYLLGHEWSHALQHAFLSQLDYPARELQIARKALREEDQSAKKDGGVVDWNYLLDFLSIFLLRTFATTPFPKAV